MTSRERQAPSSRNGESAAEEARYQTVLAQESTDSSAVTTLIAHLGDRSWRVRKAAVSRLQGLEAEPTVIPALVAGLASDDNAGLRNACAEALSRLGNAAVRELERTLASPDPDHRRFVVEALGSIGSEESCGALVEALGDDDQNVRAAAAEALGHVGGPGAVTPLRLRLAAAGDDLLQQVYILEALAKAAAQLSYAELASFLDRRELRRPVLTLLGRCGDPRAGEHLVAGLTSAARTTRATAACALDTLLSSAEGLEQGYVEGGLAGRPDILDQLERLLEEPDDEAVAAAVRLLGRLGDADVAPKLLHACACRSVVGVGTQVVLEMGKAAVEPLVRELDLFDIESRVLFLEVLEVLGDASLIPTLLEVAAGPETRTAETAVRVIGSLGNVDMAPALVELGRSADDELARVIAMTLGVLGTDDPDPVAAVLRQELERGEVRPAWLAALGALGCAEDIDLVSAATRHPDSEVRCAAVEAAAGFDGRFPEETLIFTLADEQPVVRVAAARALSAYASAEATNALITATRDADAWVVAQAIRSLGVAARPEAVETVMAAAGSTASPIAIAALQSLFRIHPEGLDDCVKKALEHADAEVVCEAVTLSMRLSEESAHPLLLSCLEHRSWNVRAEAAESMLRRGMKAPRDLVQACLLSEHEPLVQEPLERLLRASEVGS